MLLYYQLLIVMRSMLFQWMKFNFLQEKEYVMYKHGIYQKY